MKKLLTFCAAICAAATLFAAERVVWEGNKAISWNTDVYAGEQFETPDGTFADLLKDDTIKVSVEAKIDAPQYVMTYKAGDSWEWTDLEGVNVAEGIMTYVVASDEIAGFIAQRGLIFRGQGYDMTKIVIATPDSEPVDPIDPEEPDTLLPGEERVLWDGEETLSWNEVAEQPASVGVLLAENDQLIVTVSAKGAADWPKVLIRDMSSNQVGDDILLNEVSEFPYEAVFTLAAAHAEALADGFKLCGDGVTVTKLVLKKYKEEDEPVEPEDETIDLTGMTETVVWTGNQHISWNSAEYAGDKLDTYAVQQDMFAGLQVGNVIVVVVTPDGEAEYALKYKAGDDWSWTELTINTEAADTLAYEVESEEIAQLIADRGLVLDGIRYIATKISIFRAPTSAIINTSTAVPARKIIEAGQVVIIKDGVRYNILGAVVH